MKQFLIKCMAALWVLAVTVGTIAGEDKPIGDGTLPTGKSDK